MLGDKIKVQSKVVSDYTDEQLLFIKQMGVKYVYVIFKDEHTDYDSVMRTKERLDKFGLEITDAGNVHLYKSDKIHLGLPGRDEAIEAYNQFKPDSWKSGNSRCVHDMGAQSGTDYQIRGQHPYKRRCWTPGRYRRAEDPPLFPWKIVYQRGDMGEL